MATIHMGVRAFVEFTVRFGDLNPLTTNSTNTASMGAKIHRKLQAAYPKTAEKEVFLSHTVPLLDDDLTLEGRADGVLQEGATVLLQEIKTAAQAWATLPKNTKARYWAQADVYGHLLCRSRHLEELVVELVYVQTNTDEVTRFRETKTAQALAAAFAQLVAELADWRQLRQDLVTARDHSVQHLAFPFSAYRAGQRELAVAVYKTIAAKTRLFVEAPTGTGKTISTLFPTLKAMGAGLIQRCFYLTAKESTRHVAEGAMALMAQHGLQAKSITLTAKATITFLDAPEDPAQNPYMLGYYDRLKPALKDLLAHEDQLTRAVIETYARKHTLDPFEFSLDASLFCDVIICDYNYVFDPAVTLQRFFATADTEQFFLVDEAHNLVSRAREMYSAGLSDTLFTTLKSALAPFKRPGLPHLKGNVTKLLTAFDVAALNLPAQQTEVFIPTSPPALIGALKTLSDSIHDWLSQESHAQDQAVRAVLLPAYFELLAFLRIQDLYDDAFETKIELTPTALTVKQLCLDPSAFIDAALAKGRGAVLFSATLSPMRYYQDVLGGADDALAYRLPSPFAPQKQAVVVATHIQTTYRHRAQSLPQVVAALGALVQAKPGHYLVFLPAYGYLDQVASAFQQAHPDALVYVQQPQMDAAARAAYLDHFQNDARPCVGFAILGGIFSEGIDLKGDKLLGVAVVSVGLPGLNSETDRLKAYFDRQNGQGFAYAYQLPGFNHVLQAGGRVIRGAHDVGVVLLLDARFATPRYAELFPPHWAHAQVAASTAQLKAQLADFWRQHDQDRPNA